MKKAHPKGSKLYTPKEIREIANAADVDPKTVARYLDGEKELRPSTRSRIRGALVDLGMVR